MDMVDFLKQVRESRDSGGSHTASSWIGVRSAVEEELAMERLSQSSFNQPILVADQYSRTRALGSGSLSAKDFLQIVRGANRDVASDRRDITSQARNTYSRTTSIARDSLESSPATDKTPVRPLPVHASRQQQPLTSGHQQIISIDHREKGRISQPASLVCSPDSLNASEDGCLPSSTQNRAATSSGTGSGDSQQEMPAQSNFADHQLLSPKSSIVRTLERLRTSQAENVQRHEAIERLRAEQAKQRAELDALIHEEQHQDQQMLDARIQREQALLHESEVQAAADAPPSRPGDGAQVQAAADAPPSRPGDGAQVQAAADAPPSRPGDGSQVQAAADAPPSRPGDGAQVQAAADAPPVRPGDGAQVPAADAPPVRPGDGAQVQDDAGAAADAPELQPAPLPIASQSATWHADDPKLERPRDSMPQPGIPTQPSEAPSAFSALLSSVAELTDSIAKSGPRLRARMAAAEEGLRSTEPIGAGPESTMGASTDAALYHSGVPPLLISHRLRTGLQAAGRATSTATEGEWLVLRSSHIRQPLTLSEQAMQRRHIPPAVTAVARGEAYGPDSHPPLQLADGLEDGDKIGRGKEAARSRYGSPERETSGRPHALSPLESPRQHSQTVRRPLQFDDLGPSQRGQLGRRAMLESASREITLHRSPSATGRRRSPEGALEFNDRTDFGPNDMRAQARARVQRRLREMAQLRHSRRGSGAGWELVDSGNGRQGGRQTRKHSGMSWSWASRRRDRRGGSRPASRESSASRSDGDDHRWDGVADEHGTLVHSQGSSSGRSRRWDVDVPRRLHIDSPARGTQGRARQDMGARQDLEESGLGGTQLDREQVEGLPVGVRVGSGKGLEPRSWIARSSLRDSHGGGTARVDASAQSGSRGTALLRPSMFT